MNNLILILSDQLSASMTSLAQINPDKDQILMCEVWEEATYVRHHKKKIVFIFSAMRHFAQDLQAQGLSVHYTTLTDTNNTGSLLGEVKQMLKSQHFDQVIVTHPSEYRLWHEMQQWQNELDVPVIIKEDDRFLCTKENFAEWAKDRKQLRMEYFYRTMRKQHNILMTGVHPTGGQWNYDTENRKPPQKGMCIPAPFTIKQDGIIQAVLKLVADKFSSHFGDLEPFHWAVTRTDALAALRLFIKQRLPSFGDYQDAMIQDEPWMYHSHLSFYLNCGLLLPAECIQMAITAYEEGQAPLNAVEGFVRQLLGWREYVRGIYWLTMPDYAQTNYLHAQRQLPDFYWHGQTHMNCLHQCITETKKNAYAHHIQRLMVLGNFALLAGIHPHYINEWFLIVYADAYEWVELPNVSGMILFADGGYLASKPYAAGGSYINKMSNYCQSCRYRVTKKNGPDACPFNYLYWDFLQRNRSKLQNNPRISMMYKTYDRMHADKKQAIDHDSRLFFKAIEKDQLV